MKQEALLLEQPGVRSKKLSKDISVSGGLRGIGEHSALQPSK